MQDFRNDRYKKRAKSISSGSLTPSETRSGVTKSASTISTSNVNINPSNIITSSTSNQVAISGKIEDNIVMTSKPLTEENKPIIIKKNEPSENARLIFAGIDPNNSARLSGSVYGQFFTKQSIGNQYTYTVNNTTQHPRTSYFDTTSYYAGRYTPYNIPAGSITKERLNYLEFNLLDSKPISEIRADNTNIDYFKKQSLRTEFSASRIEGSYKTILLTKSFGLSLASGFTQPVIHPIQYAKGSYQFMKGLITHPMDTGYEIGQQALFSPASFSGELVGQGLLFKSLSKVNPIKVTVVEDMNLPKNTKQAYKLFDKGNIKSGSKGKVFEADFTGDNIQKGLITGINIEFPLITGKKGSTSLLSYNKVGTKGNVFIKNPNYIKFLNNNLLYAELLKVEVSKSPIESFKYKTVITKENGNTYIRDEKITSFEQPSREIELSSGGDNYNIYDNYEYNVQLGSYVKKTGLDYVDRFGGEAEPLSASPMGGGRSGSGDNPFNPIDKAFGKIRGTLKDNRFNNLGGGKQKYDLILLEEQYTGKKLFNNEIFKPFVKENIRSLNIRFPKLFSNSLTIPKSNTKQFFKQTNNSFSGLKSSTSQFQNLKLGINSRTSQIVNTNSIQIQNIISKTLQSQSIKQIQSQSQALSQTSITKLVQVNKLIIIETPKTPKIPSILHIGGGKFFKSKGFGGLKKTRYSPSYTALLFNIRGNYKGGKLKKSGLDFRPITKGYKLTGGDYKTSFRGVA